MNSADYFLTHLADHQMKMLSVHYSGLDQKKAMLSKL